MIRRLALACLWLSLAGCARSPSEPVEVVNAWAQPTPPGASVGAIYVELRAHSADRLLGASSSIARSIEIHETTFEDGIARMRPLEGVDLQAHETVSFAPGGKHLMAIDLLEPFAPGQAFPLELSFANAGTIAVEVTVAAAPHDHADHGDHSDHGDHGYDDHAHADHGDHVDHAHH